MTTDAQGNLILEEGIKYLLSTEDPMLVELGNIIKENNDFPDEEELIQILVFFLIFTMGCKDFNLLELSNSFSKRAEKFIIVLGKWGMHSGRSRDYVKKRWDPLMYNRIIHKATAIVAYRMAGSLNKF